MQCDAGVILDAVAGPIRHYLRERKDTIRCIVTMLTDDGEDAAATSLLAELGAMEQGAEVRMGQQCCALDSHCFGGD